MANGSLLTNSAKKIIINRSYNSSPDYTVPSQFKVGIVGGTPNIADTDLDVAVPISDGTILLDGSTIFTGEDGADNSTSGTARYKEGAGTTDATSQNLLRSGTVSTTTANTWFTSTLNATGTTSQDFGFWLYINGQKTLDGFGTTDSGTAVIAFMGSGTTNYYFLQRTKTQLSTGWNWLSSGTIVSNLKAVGSPSGTVMNTFGVKINTSGTTIGFTSGSVLFDLARQWQDSDLVKNYESGYPIINETTLTSEIRCELTTIQANGFDLDSFGNFNTDAAIKISGKDVFTDESKSSTDKFIFVVQDRLN